MFPTESGCCNVEDGLLKDVAMKVTVLWGSADTSQRSATKYSPLSKGNLKDLDSSNVESSSIAVLEPKDLNSQPKLLSRHTGNSSVTLAHLADVGSEKPTPFKGGDLPSVFAEVTLPKEMKISQGCTNLVTESLAVGEASDGVFGVSLGEIARDEVKISQCCAETTSSEDFGTGICKSRFSKSDTTELNINQPQDLEQTNNVSTYVKAETLLHTDGEMNLGVATKLSKTNIGSTTKYGNMLEKDVRLTSTEAVADSKPQAHVKCVLERIKSVRNGDECNSLREPTGDATETIHSNLEAVIYGNEEMDLWYEKLASVDEQSNLYANHQSKSMLTKCVNEHPVDQADTPALLGSKYPISGNKAAQNNVESSMPGPNHIAVCPDPLSGYKKEQYRTISEETQLVLETSVKCNSPTNSDMSISESEESQDQMDGNNFEIKLEELIEHRKKQEFGIPMQSTASNRGNSPFLHKQKQLMLKSPIEGLLLKHAHSEVPKMIPHQHDFGCDVAEATERNVTTIQGRRKHKMASCTPLFDSNSEEYSFTHRNEQLVLRGRMQIAISTRLEKYVFSKRKSYRGPYNMARRNPRNSEIIQPKRYQAARTMHWHLLNSDKDSRQCNLLQLATSLTSTLPMTSGQQTLPPSRISRTTTLQRDTNNSKTVTTSDIADLYQPPNGTNVDALATRNDMLKCSVKNRLNHHSDVNVSKINRLNSNAWNNLSDEQTNSRHFSDRGRFTGTRGSTVSALGTKFHDSDPTSTTAHLNIHETVSSECQWQAQNLLTLAKHVSANNISFSDAVQAIALQNPKSSTAYKSNIHSRLGRKLSLPAHDSKLDNNSATLDFMHDSLPTDPPVRLGDEQNLRTDADVNGQEVSGERDCYCRSSHCPPRKLYFFFSKEYWSWCGI